MCAFWSLPLFFMSHYRLWLLAVLSDAAQCLIDCCIVVPSDMCSTWSQSMFNLMSTGSFVSVCKNVSWVVKSSLTASCPSSMNASQPTNTIIMLTLGLLDKIFVRLWRCSLPHLTVGCGIGWLWGVFCWLMYDAVVGNLLCSTCRHWFWCVILKFLRRIYPTCTSLLLEHSEIEMDSWSFESCRIYLVGPLLNYTCGGWLRKHNQSPKCKVLWLYAGEVVDDVYSQMLNSVKLDDAIHLVFAVIPLV